MSNMEKLPAIKSAFSALSPDNRTFLLSILALEITIRARGAYPGQEDEEVGMVKLVGFNEMQHTISGHLEKMLMKDEDRYPDDVFLDILFEKAESSSCARDLLVAIGVAFGRVGSSLDL